MMTRDPDNSPDPALLKSAFGAVVVRHRIDLGMTREQFAEMAGLGASHLCRIERGEHAPSLITIRKIADALGYTCGELLDETQENM